MPAVERLGIPLPAPDHEAAPRAMLRLMGLPPTARFPKATVTLHEDRFELLFHGGEDSRLVDVDLRYVEEAGDLEATELWLLARLQELGYVVERGSASPREREAES